MIKKSLIAVVVTLMLILSMTVTAFAGPPSGGPIIPSSAPLCPPCIELLCDGDAAEALSDPSGGPIMPG